MAPCVKSLGNRVAELNFREKGGIYNRDALAISDLGLATNWIRTMQRTCRSHPSAASTRKEWRTSFAIQVANELGSIFGRFTSRKQRHTSDRKETTNRTKRSELSGVKQRVSVITVNERSHSNSTGTPATSPDVRSDQQRLSLTTTSTILRWLMGFFDNWQKCKKTCFSGEISSFQRFLQSVIFRFQDYRLRPLGHPSDPCFQGFS